MPDAESPFHRGEKEIQSRLGIDEKAEKLGRRMIRYVKRSACCPPRPRS